MGTKWTLLSLNDTEDTRLLFYGQAAFDSTVARVTITLQITALILSKPDKSKHYIHHFLSSFLDPHNQSNVVFQECYIALEQWQEKRCPSAHDRPVHERLPSLKVWKWSTNGSIKVKYHELYSHTVIFAKVTCSPSHLSLKPRLKCSVLRPANQCIVSVHNIPRMHCRSVRTAH